MLTPDSRLKKLAFTDAPTARPPLPAAATVTLMAVLPATPAMLTYRPLALPPLPSATLPFAAEFITLMAAA